MAGSSDVLNALHTCFAKSKFFLFLLCHSSLLNLYGICLPNSMYRMTLYVASGHENRAGFYRVTGQRSRMDFPYLKNNQGIGVRISVIIPRTVFPRPSPSFSYKGGPASGNVEPAMEMAQRLAATADAA